VHPLSVSFALEGSCHAGLARDKRHGSPPAGWRRSAATGGAPRLLARKSFAALPSGGRILLNEILMDDDGTGPWVASAFRLMMLLATLDKQYSLPELREILESAGFAEVEAVRTQAIFAARTSRDSRERGLC